MNYFYCYPIKIDNILKGYLNFFSTQKSGFNDIRKLPIKIVSKFAEVAIRQYEIEKNYNKTLKEAIEEMARVTGDNRRDQILLIVFKYAKKLLRKKNILSSVIKLNEKKGVLTELKSEPPTIKDTITYKEGYCSKALKEEEPIICDINSANWDEVYVDAWKKGTKSELVIPLLIKKEQIRLRNNVVTATRPIGVLNFESKNLNEFTEEDVANLLPLISQASLLIEKLTIERKLEQVRNIEKSVLSKQSLKQSLHTIAEGIRDVLEFEIVNISLVNDSKGTIDTLEIIGIEDENRKV